MSVSNNVNRINYAGNGTTLAFAFAGKSFLAANFKVIVTVDSTLVSTTQTLTTDYSVAIAGDEDSATITMVVSPAVGETLSILYREPLTQLTAYVNNDGVPAATVEKVGDRGILVSQTLNETQDRCPRLVEASAVTQPLLPDLPNQAGKLVRVNATEDGYSYVEIDLTVITNAQVQFLQKDIYNQIIDITFTDSPYTILADDEGALYRCDTAGGTIIMNLPAMSTQTEDLKYGFVKQSGDANAITVTASGSELISGAATRTIDTRYAMMVVVGDFDNDEWFHQGTTQSLADINKDTFVGDASTVAFVLTVDPISENNTQVYINGIYQEKDTYSVSGTTLTFSEAPPARATDTSNIEVIYLETLAIGVPADLSVTTGKIATAAVTLAKMADLAADTIIGRANGAGTGVPTALTKTQVLTILNVEDGADVTDATNVTAAGALMDSEVTSLAAVKDVILTSGLTIAANWEAADETKFDAIEALADVTDATNVNAAGAVMETDFNAQTVLVAVADDTPLPVTVGASTVVGRAASGNVVALTMAQLNTILLRPEMLPFSLGNETTLQTTGLKLTWRIRQAFELTAIFGELTTAATDATFIMDVHLNGTTIMDTTKVQILTTATDDDGNAALSTTTLAVDDILTFYVDQIGSTLAGKGPKINLIGYQL